MPLSRIGDDACWGSDNRFYMFGGSRSPWSNYLCDLWVFTPDSSCSGYCQPQMPVAIFSAPNHICPGTCTDFNNLSLNATSFLWTFAGANPSTSTDVSPTNICYNIPGTYTVSLIATNANGSDTLTLNNFITVYPYPAPQVIAQSGDTLFANSGAVSYQWYHNGNSIPGATDYFYVATEGGDYNVVATDNNSCEVEAAIFDVVAAIASAIDNGPLAIFPNPVLNKLAVGNRQYPITAIKIFNVIGEQTFEIQHNTDFNNKIEIDVSRLTAGLYYLEITAGEKMFRNKFMKQ